MLLGRHWIPAPTFEIWDAVSRTVTLWLATRLAVAAPRRTRPPPAMGDPKALLKRMDLSQFADCGADFELASFIPYDLLLDMW